MALTTKTQDALVQSQVAAMQASSSALLDFGLGSVLLAICQAVASVGLWLQALVIQLAALTRLATSFGSDVDTFINPFGMTRLAAVAASGLATFARFSANGQVVVPVGATVETADGTQTFAVALDATNAAYSSTLGGYVLAAGVVSLSAPIQAVTPGAAGNAASGTITVISDAIPGVDTVTNPTSLTNGSDQETDAAVKVRFPLFIASRAQGTPAAVEYAASSVAQNLSYKLVENYAYTGAYQPGYFYVVIDDGSAAAAVSATSITAVQAALAAARPLTSQFGAFSRVLVPVSIGMTISGGSVAAVQAALAAYVANAGLGGSVLYSRLSQIAYDADPAVSNVTGVTLNGGTADVVGTAQQRPSVATITVTPA